MAIALRPQICDVTSPYVYAACIKRQLIANCQYYVGTVEKSEKLSRCRRKKGLRQLFNANNKDASNLEAT